MDRDQPLPSASLCGTRETLFAMITSFKICMTIYFFFMFLQELFWAIPLMVFGTTVIFLVLRYFQVPVASAESVAAFFGSGLRPTMESLEPVSTIRSRLQVQSLPHQPGSTKESGQSITIIAHRGGGLDAPENSISAFRLCKTRGCNAVEFDVSITKDNVPVLFHDDNIMRMTGIDRDVTDMTWNELKQVDISVRHPLGENFAGEKVPTFEEGITTCLSLGLKFFIDLKDNGDERVIEIIVDFFKKYPAMYQSASITSFSPKLVYLIRRRDPNIIGCLGFRPGYHQYRVWNETGENLQLRSSSFILSMRDMLWDFLEELARSHIYWWFLGLSAYNVHKDCLSLEETYRWTNKGIRIFLATPNAPLEKLHMIQNMRLGYFTDTVDVGDLTSSSKMPNYSEISVGKLRSSSNSVGIADVNTNSSK